MGKLPRVYRAGQRPPQAACIQPIADGIVVENDTDALREMRRELIEMLFVEGNHFCPFCEKSGNCELQAMGYRLGMLAPQYPYFFPVRDVDASHPDLFLDRKPLHPVRALRAGLARAGRQARVRFRGARREQARGGQCNQRAGRDQRGGYRHGQRDLSGGLADEEASRLRESHRAAGV